MKTTLLFAFISLILTGNSIAQTAQPRATITGTVTDSAKNQPMAFVTVLLKDAASAQQIRSVLSKDNGSFEVSAGFCGQQLRRCKL